MTQNKRERRVWKRITSYGRKHTTLHHLTECDNLKPYVPMENKQPNVNFGSVVSIHVLRYYGSKGQSFLSSADTSIFCCVQRYFTHTGTSNWIQPGRGDHHGWRWSTPKRYWSVTINQWPWQIPPLGVSQSLIGKQRLLHIRVASIHRFIISFLWPHIGSFDPRQFRWAFYFAQSYPALLKLHVVISFEKILLGDTLSLPNGGSLPGFKTGWL